jgi:hypothetical protein
MYGDKMSKKSRRARPNFKAVPKTQNYIPGTPAVAARPVIKPSYVPSAIKSPSNTVKPESFAHLIPDLRNIGIVTVIVLFVLLIAWFMINPSG